MTQIATLRKGSRLGKYRLDRRLGRGTFAQVWRARDTVESRDVALKILNVSNEKDASRLDIEREARIAARLSHPNIVAVRNADWVDGCFVIATDLASRTLGSHRGARRSAKLALSLLRDVAAGLAHAHSKRIMHLDLKPENIMIFPDGRAALADFGTSRMSPQATRTYTEAGTLGYLAPEQAYGKPRFASDVFTLGLIAYELLAGKLPSWPFNWPPGPEYERFAERVPEPVRAVIKKAAAFQPARRYSDGIELLHALEQALRAAEKPRPKRKLTRKPPLPAPPSPLVIEGNMFRRRYGAALGMRCQCRSCEGPIAESMVHCPWCGTDDHSFAEVTSYPLVCPECERGVKPEWTCCPWCYRGRFQGNGQPPKHDPESVRHCSRRGCAGELRPFMRYCPICKQKPRRVWSHRALQDRCPRCRWPVNRLSWRFCPWCGRREPKAGTFVRQRPSTNG